MARIAVGGFHHETNSFMPTKTDFAYFQSHRDRPPLVRGADVVKWLTNTSFGLSGFLEKMSGKHDIVPLLWTSGGAGGTVTRDAFERISAELVGTLSVSMPVDAIYLDLHGAMVTEDFEDGEGEVLRRIRAAVGPDIPIVISLDYHANVTPQIVDLTDGMAAYYTYPHVDREQTGQRAAKILSTILERGRPAGRALRKIPFLIPLNFQSTLIEPSKGIVESSAKAETGDILSAAYLAGFPPADLRDCGPSVIVHAYTQDQADAAADRLADQITAAEANFIQPLFGVDEGISKAIEIARTATRPVVVADTQDNPGCGGTADTTGVLEALVRLGATDAVLGIFWDPDAAARAHQAGEGKTIRLALGGKHGPAGVKPYEADFVVSRLGSGQIVSSGVAIGRRKIDLGPMATLTIGGVSVVVSSKRMQAHDRELFRHVGIEPAKQKILAVKSAVHFRAEFEPMAEAVIVVLAPGGHIVDPGEYDYARLRAGVRLGPLGPGFKPRAGAKAPAN
ncbi:MAG: M81 family metallopeptidase [Proteobacteria bacterium]|nr:M81 family metallopeptidase [Pseudomonadota bacterium]